MQTLRRFRLIGGVVSLSAVTILVGCGESVPTEAAKPVPLYNPDPNNPNKDVTLENEGGQMKRLKEQTKVPATKNVGRPTLPQ
jgi:hypothetical protein